MLNNHSLNYTLMKIGMAEHSLIQNLGRFYVYDMSRYCGGLDGWECPENGLYECNDFQKYLDKPDTHAFLIRVNGEIGGFVFVNKPKEASDIDWNMGEFFILAKFQGKGLGQNIATEIFQKFPGKWMVCVIQSNTKALSFWRKTIRDFTIEDFEEEEKITEELKTKKHFYPMKQFSFSK